jgi:hypothetical protein
MNFIDDMQINPSPFLMKLVVRRGSDVKDANCHNLNLGLATKATTYKGAGQE